MDHKTEHSPSTVRARTGRGKMAAIALAGGLVLAAAGCSKMESLVGSGPGGADRNGDGKISLSEFGAELKEMKHPKQGRWKISFEGHPGNDEKSFIRFSTEANVCGPADFWDGFDMGIAELSKPENEAKFKEGLEKFAKENNGKFDLERFDIDGENIELKMSGSGKGDEPPVKGDGGGEIAIKGKVSETLVDLAGDFSYHFNIKGSEQGTEFAVEANMATVTKFKGERIGDCPVAPPQPTMDEQSFAPDAAAPAEEEPAM